VWLLVSGTTLYIHNELFVFGAKKESKRRSKKKMKK